MYSLAEMLGLSGLAERKFRREIEQNERKILSGESISARMSAEIYENSHLILRELGFKGNDVLAREAYSALKNKFLGDKILVSEGDFWQKYNSSIVICDDGLVSANKLDIEHDIKNDLSFETRSLGNARREIRQKLLNEYNKNYIKNKEKK